MNSRVRLGSVFALLVVTTVLALPVPVEAHPYHLQVANEILVGTDNVDLTHWLAESFTAPTSFWVSRVSVYVADTGTPNVLNVSIRADATGFPVTSELTQGSTFASPIAAWTDVDLSPFVALQGGQTYWIVLKSNLAQGHQWWHSGNEAAYTGGVGARSSDGVVWNLRGHDLTFRVYGFYQPSLSFAASVSDSSPQPGDQPVFRVNVTNSGTGDAAFVWANLTLAPELAYVSDDAAAAGGSRSGTYNFTFASVPPGVLSFNLTTSVNGGTPNGTIATTVFRFDSTDHNGVLQPRITRSVGATVRNARLTLSLTPAAGTARPGDSVSFNATAANGGLAAASSVDLVGTVDPGVFFVSSSPGTAYDPGTRTVRRAGFSLAAGASANIGWIVRVPVGTPDGTRISADAGAAYRDPSGAAMPNETRAVVVTVHVPLFSIGLAADRGEAEKGDLIAVTMDYTNTGSGSALGAWANWTIMGNYVLLSLTPAQPFTPTPAGFDVSLANVGPGQHSMVASLRVQRGLSDGFAMPVQVRWIATDGNGNPLAPATLSVAVSLRAPSVTVGAEPAMIRVETDASFIVNATLRNPGRAAAEGTMNVTLPPGVDYAGDNGTFPSTVQGQNVTWRISVPAGAVIVVGVRLLGRQVLVAALRFSVAYSDGRGTPPLTVASGSVLVTVTVGTPATPPWIWIGMGLAVVAGAFATALVAWRRRKSAVAVEDIFVSDLGGVLLAHRSSTIVPYEDEDILVGMFKIVQDFVRDAFSKGRHEEMRSLEFGERTILIERGKSHFIAVVYRGTDRGELAIGVRQVSREIDERFEEQITTWRGDMEAVRGITLLLAKIQGEKTRGRTAPQQGAGA